MSTPNRLPEPLPSPLNWVSRLTLARVESKQSERTGRNFSALTFHVVFNNHVYAVFDYVMTEGPGDWKMVPLLEALVHPRKLQRRNEPQRTLELDSLIGAKCWAQLRYRTAATNARWEIANYYPTRKAAGG